MSGMAGGASRKSRVCRRAEPDLLRRAVNSVLEHYTLDDAAHLIQVALTPVFLLSGIGALLNVFASRLARVADQLTALTKAIQGVEAMAEETELLRLLRLRSLILDFAVVLATGGAAATCLAIITLFLFALSNKAIASVLLLLFGLAILCTLAAVVAFGLEMVLSNRAIRRRLRLHLPHIPWRRERKP
jgi:hypothetical protein